MFTGIHMDVHSATTDAAVIALGAQVLRIEAWAEPMFGASIVASGAMQGAGDSTSCFVLNIFIKFFKSSKS